MQIIKNDQNQKSSVILIPDHCPNAAMINEFQTSFFSFKINHLELVEGELQGYQVDSEAQYLLVDMTLRNQTNEILSMFRGDFLIAYDGEAAFEAEEFFSVAHQLPNEYALKPNEAITGKLIYIISKSAKRITLRFTEYFDDDSEGKTYRLRYRIQS